LALAKLKKLYRRDPRPSLVAMGAELGYSKSTVSDNIRKMKEKGELE
jgi:DNA-binding MarR family transcriptional regulator